MNEEVKHCPDCEPDPVLGILCDKSCACHYPLNVMVEDEYGVGDYMGNKPAQE